MPFSEIGGERVSMCGFEPSFKYGMTACDVKKVPRTFTSIIRSNLLAGVFRVFVKFIALALLIRISIPPINSAALFTAAVI